MLKVAESSTNLNFLNRKIVRKICLLVGIIYCLVSSEGLAAKKSYREEKTTLTPWFGIAGISYSDYQTPKELGGGHTVSTNLQLGLSLIPSTSIFMLAAYKEEPDGFQDVRVGVSTSTNLTDAVGGFLSLTGSLPTSKYSRSIYLTTQVSGAGGVSVTKGAFAFQTVLYGAISYYSLRPRVAKVSSSPNGLKLSPGRALAADTTDSDGNNGPINTGTPAYIGLVLFDKYYGESLGLSYKANVHWTFETSASLTRTTYANANDVWTSELTFIQITWLKKVTSLFANIGSLNNNPSPLMPKTRTYAAGINYSFR